MERADLAPHPGLGRVSGIWRRGEDEDASPAKADLYGGFRAEALRGDAPRGDALRAAPGLLDRIEPVTDRDIAAPAGRHAGARLRHRDIGAAHVAASVAAAPRDMATGTTDPLQICRPDPLTERAVAFLQERGLPLTASSLGGGAPFENSDAPLPAALVPPASPS